MDSSLHPDPNSGVDPELGADVVAQSVPAEEPRDDEAAKHVEDRHVEVNPAEAVPTLGLRWTVTDEPNPFHRRLVFSNDGDAVLDLSLDPLLLQDLLAALAYVRESQRAVLGMADTPPPAIVTPRDSPVPSAPVSVGDAGVAAPSVAPPAPASASEDTETDTTIPVTAGPSAFTTLAWWRSHKLLAFLLLFGVVFFIVGSLTSPG